MTVKLGHGYSISLPALSISKVVDVLKEDLTHDIFALESETKGLLKKLVNLEKVAINEKKSDVERVEAAE